MSSLREAVTVTNLSGQYKFLATGKVRDLYEIDATTLLFVATDRVSAFDVVGLLVST
jgi:phosphoribosylaminoimidazole-succinocarboxamide synthase